MTKMKTAFAALAIVLASPLSAATDDVLPSAGDDISKFRDAGAWVIHKNATRGSCFAAYESADGAVVQFGFTKAEDFGYLGLFSKTAEPADGINDIAFLANGHPYVGKSVGAGQNLNDGYKGGYVLINNPNFVKDIEIGQELVAFPDSPMTYIVDMRGAKNALYEVRKCTAELN